MGKKEAYYFSHDSNARSDPKILAMRSIYGSEGYGWYWILIELMRDEPEHKLKLKGKYTFNAYAKELEADVNKVKEYVSDCIKEFELFDSDGEFFWSNSLLRRMQLYQEKCEKARAAIQKRWENRNKEQQEEQPEDSQENDSDDVLL